MLTKYKAVLWYSMTLMVVWIAYFILMIKWISSENVGFSNTKLTS